MPRPARAKIIENFYTEAVITAVGSKEFELDKVLVDAGAVVNLIPEWVVEKAKLTITPDSSLCVRGYNGEIRGIEAYCLLIVSVGGIARKILVYICPTVGACYTLLLSRNWLNSVDAIGLYGKDEY